MEAVNNKIAPPSQSLFILYGFCNSYSSVYKGFARRYFSCYMAFAIITLNFVWLLPQLLFISYGFCNGYSLLYMAFVKRLLIIKLPHPLLVQPLSHSSFDMAFATVTLHSIWLLQQLLFNVYGLCQGLLCILHGFGHNHSSIYIAYATSSLHFIWALQRGTLHVIWLLQ